VTAFAPPRTLCLSTALRFGPAFTGLTLLRSHLTCGGPIALSSFPPQGWLTAMTRRCNPHTSLRVRQTNFVPLALSIHMQQPANIGLRHWELAHPLHMPYDTSLSFARITHLWLLPHIPSRALFSEYSRLIEPWSPTAMHLPPRCWVPFARVPGLDSHLLFVCHAEHTPLPTPAYSTEAKLI
jgi:hypothetical protein